MTISYGQQHSYPIAFDSNSIMGQKLEYLYQNPVEAGYVTHAAAWHYSSAAAYAGERKDFKNLLYVEYGNESETLSR